MQRERIVDSLKRTIALLESTTPEEDDESLLDALEDDEARAIVEAVCSARSGDGWCAGLPSEMWYHIATMLSFPEAASVMSTCRRLRDLIRRTDSLWRIYYMRRFGSTHRPAYEELRDQVERTGRFTFWRWLSQARSARSETACCGLGADGTVRNRTYYGEWKAHAYDGLGILVNDRKGHCYAGHLSGGFPHGRGCKVWNRMEHCLPIRYEGAWAWGRMSGEGMAWYPDGSRYVGEWLHDLPHGEGSLHAGPHGEDEDSEWHFSLHPDGAPRMSATLYEGQFRNGQRHGPGMQQYDDGTCYKGDWHRDRFLKGTLAYPSGERYEGEWGPHGGFVRRGFGRATFPDGSSYEGNWLDDRANGYGVWTIPSGLEITALWDHEMPRRDSVCTIRVGHARHPLPARTIVGANLTGPDVEMDVLDAGHYTGAARWGVRHGRGVMRYGNRTRYEGDWRDDMRHGQGTFEWTNGTRTSGEWRFDAQEGMGRMTQPNGDVFEGSWERGKRDGAGFRWSASRRTVWEEVWTAGVRRRRRTVSTEEVSGLDRVAPSVASMFRQAKGLCPRSAPPETHTDRDDGAKPDGP